MRTTENDDWAGIIIAGIAVAILSCFAPFSILTGTKHGALLASANSSRDAVEQREQSYVESMDVLLDRLEAAIHLIEPNDLLGERLTIGELRKLIEPMRAKAREVLDAHANFGSAAEAFDNEASKAIPIMKEVANQFATYSKEENFADLQESYQTVSESLLSVASKYQERRAKIEPATEAVNANIVYIERSELFLVRLHDVLHVFPEESPASEGFLRRVAEYVQAFERLRELLQKFHGATTGELPRPNESTPQPSVSRVDHGPITDGVPNLPRSQAAFLDENLQVEEKMMATPEAPPAKVPTAVCEVHRNTEVPETSTQAAQVAVTTYDLTGLWNVGNGRVGLRVTQDGSSVAVSLHRGSIESHGYGTLRFIDNDTLMVVELVYLHESGQQLRESGLTWEVVGNDSIRARSYRHVPNQDGGIRRSNDVVHYDVHRVNS